MRDLSWQNLAGAWKWWLLVIMVLLLDQVTKHWAEAALNYNEPWVITSFFNFTLRYNPGAAFSFLADQPGWQRWFFTVITTVVSVLLVYWIGRSAADRRQWLEPMGYALILAGALGNLYDRVVYGHVVDFIVVHYQEYAWPAFNIADSAICGGVVLLILDMLIKSRKHHE